MLDVLESYISMTDSLQQSSKATFHGITDFQEFFFKKIEDVLSTFDTSAFAKTCSYSQLCSVSSLSIERCKCAQLLCTSPVFTQISGLLWRVAILVFVLTRAHTNYKCKLEHLMTKFNTACLFHLSDGKAISHSNWWFWQHQYH